MKIKFRSVITRTVEFDEDQIRDVYNTTDREKIQRIEQLSVEDDPLVIYDDEDANWEHEVTIED